MSSSSMQRTTLWIRGMRDCRCRDLIAEALESVAGVDAADVNLFRASATVTHLHGCSPADLIQAIEQAGYGAALDEGHGLPVE